MIGHPYKGQYIAFEGIGCCGKTTQMDRFQMRLEREGYCPEGGVLFTKEPGGTDKANRIASILLEKGEEPFDQFESVLLFAACRSHSVRLGIVPILERGGLVITDRSVLSSICYQGQDGEGPFGKSSIYKLNNTGLSGVFPNRIIIFDISPEVLAERMIKRGERNNSFDEKTLEYFRGVRQNYLEYARFLSQAIKVIDGTLPIETQEGMVWDYVGDEIKKLVGDEIDHSPGRRK